MSELRVHGLGAAVTLQPQTDAAAELLPDVETAWAWCLEVPNDVVDAGEVAIPDHTLDERAGTMQRLTQSITQSLIRARAGELFLFHAAALCHPRTGATVMAVAPGGTGKTTLAKTLGTTYGYLSDETTAILDDGRIIPYPKPLSLRAAEGPKIETSPVQLGLLRASVDPWLAGVILLTRDPNATIPDVLELPLLDAMAAMAPESSSMSTMSRPLHRLRDLLAPVEPVLRVTYAEASQLDELVDQLIGTP